VDHCLNGPGQSLHLAFRLWGKNRTLFEAAINMLVKVIAKTAGLTLMTAGERRYGNL